MFTIRVKRKSLRRLEKFDRSRRNAIKDALIVLKSDPLPYKKLDIIKHKGYENMYRIRIGNLRIVYEVSWSERIITIHYVGFRGKAYR